MKKRKRADNYELNFEKKVFIIEISNKMPEAVT